MRYTKLNRSIIKGKQTKPRDQFRIISQTFWTSPVGHFLQLQHFNFFYAFFVLKSLAYEVVILIKVTFDRLTHFGSSRQLL